MEEVGIYIHDYPSCSRTYATLCIYHDDLIPSKITKLLGIKPSYSQKKGDAHDTRKGRTAPVGGWFLTTRDIIESRDVRYHITILTSKVAMKQNCFKLLRDQGYDIRISCFWESASGNGGPLLDYKIMSVLSELFIDVHFDVWFSDQRV